MITLSIVATPIGNLEDCTIRSLRVLREAQLIIAEDTRSTGKLLKLLGVDTSSIDFVSYHAQSSNTALTKALEKCENYERIALVLSLIHISEPTRPY